MGDFGEEDNTEVKSQDNYYSTRVNQMQPAMVEFETEDNVERQLRYELSNLQTEENVYFEAEDSSDSMIESSFQSIDASVNMVKPTLEQASQAIASGQAPKTNKAIVYGGIAAIAALMFFGQD
jgi:CHASE3 domain sensor protein